MGKTNAKKLTSSQPTAPAVKTTVGGCVKEISRLPPAEWEGRAPPGAIEPVFAYGRGSGDFQGGAVVGGYVYRGPDPELQGRYFFADTLSSNLWTLDASSPGTTVDNINDDIPAEHWRSSTPSPPLAKTSRGNLYLVNVGSSSFQPPLGTGAIYRLVTDAVVPGDFNGDGRVDTEDLVEWRASDRAGAGQTPMKTATLTVQTF